PACGDRRRAEALQHTCGLSAQPPLYIITLHLLSSLARRQPGSTLFPYTTLFRSVVRCCSNASPMKKKSRSPIRKSKTRSMPSPTDRKSTRLNSSHSQISYAVFCLKKKIQG